MKFTNPFISLQKKMRDHDRIITERQKQWHAIFAWYPLFFNDKIYWLETVERRLTRREMFTGTRYEYKQVFVYREPGLDE